MISRERLHGVASLRSIASLLLYLCLGTYVICHAYLSMVTPNAPLRPDSRSWKERWHQARYVFVLSIFCLEIILMVAVILIHQLLLMFAVNFLLNATRSAIRLGLDLPPLAVQTGLGSCLIPCSYSRLNTWFSNTMSHRSWGIIMLLIMRQSSRSERRCETSFCPSPVKNRQQLHGRAQILFSVYHHCGKSKI